MKALLRRAAARIKLQKFEHAEADLLSVLEYEPKNMESLKQLQDLRNKTNKREENVVGIKITHYSLIILYPLAGIRSETNVKVYSI